MEKLFLPLSQLLLLLLHGCSGLWLGECNKPLGVSTGELLDSALTASSAHDNIVGPHRASQQVTTDLGNTAQVTTDLGNTEQVTTDLGNTEQVTTDLGNTEQVTTDLWSLKKLLQY
ncbi:putative discoidin domain-containing receptor A-like [Homarus americanus]|uniref:Putative discoidin domain-containing receptor A-like n=1 Tax=Homarus americanus TaxID=6706 RepID=A0A8J5N434_HOMAM|nr:putative discoidin domain-containing receptor A-like [Homarus americanus]